MKKLFDFKILKKDGTELIYKNATGYKVVDSALFYIQTGDEELNQKQFEESVIWIPILEIREVKAIIIDRFESKKEHLEFFKIKKGVK